MKMTLLNKNQRYPNLGTVIMVEEFLKENKDIPIKLSYIRKKLPKQVMHQTLKVILNYLWESGKIMYGPKGVQWIYTSSKEINKMMENSIKL